MTQKPHKLNLWHRNQQGQDDYQGLVLKPYGRLRIGNNKEAVCDYLHSAVDDFSLTPAAAVAAGRDPWFVFGGTGGTAPKSDKGGVTLTAATDTNAAFLAGAAEAAAFVHKIRAGSLSELEWVVNLASLAACFYSFGWNENITDVDPQGTAGDGAAFLADPAQAATSTGLTAAQHLNWILAHKVNGVDTFAATTVPLIAGSDVKLSIVIDANLKANFYINDNLVGQGPALTNGDTIKAFGGVESVTGSKTADVRLIAGGRAIG